MVGEVVGVPPRVGIGVAVLASSLLVERVVGAMVELESVSVVRSAGDGAWLSVVVETQACSDRCIGCERSFSGQTE